MSYARRTDTGHQEIREAIRKCGWVCFDTSRVGQGFFDLVAVKAGRVAWIELKDGNKSPSRRQLRPSQVLVHEAFRRAGAEVVVLESLDDLVQLERPGLALRDDSR